MSSSLSRKQGKKGIFAAAGAVLFVTLSLGCWYWLVSRGAFSNTMVECPIRLESGSSRVVRFSVPTTGDHDIGLWYRRDASNDVGKDVRQISGRATLRSGDSIIDEKALPVDHGRTDANGSAMIIFTRPMVRRTDYSLSLEITGIPPKLATSEGFVRTDVDHLYPLVFSQVEFASGCFFLISLGCLAMSLRRREGKTS